MAGTTAATLEEARDLSRWGHACNVILLLITPIYGKARALNLLGKAVDWAIPPDGKRPWPFAEGVVLEDHLLPLIEACRNHDRRDPNVTRRVGSSETVEYLADAGKPTPEQEVVQRDLLRKTAAEIRARFADDPEALAIFESVLRPGAESDAALPAGKAYDRALTRLHRFTGPLKVRLLEAP